MTRAWILGQWRSRWPEQLAVSAALALAIAMLAVLGAFFASSTTTMTARAVSTISPDWQVLVNDGSDPQLVTDTLAGVDHFTASSTVGYASLRALTATLSNTSQTTGQAVAVGLTPDYAAKFPRQFRILQGTTGGVMLAQQTAANLHAKPGDAITLQLMDGTAHHVTVGAVVEMPLADSFFQLVGGQATTAPRAPPDNVVLLPMEQWQQLFADQLASMPGTARLQVHVALDHAALPGDPVAAYDITRQSANNAEAQLAGDGVVGNNLAIRLDGARSDALYMKVLFLFLGLPGAVLALLFSSAVISSGQQRHLRDAALLKMRGFGTTAILRLALANSLSVAALGALLGAIAATAISLSFFGQTSLTASLHWLAAAILIGVVAAILLYTVPSWLSVRRLNVAEALRGHTSAIRPRLWRRSWLDVILVGLALLAFWQSASTGYQVVVAPEGVPTASVDYKAFIAPALMWIGTVLLLARLWSWVLRKGAVPIAALVTPLAGRLANPVAQFVCHNRLASVRGVALLALAFSFAVSTAIFNTTYQQQAGVDAMLTNGADVTVTGTPVMPASPFLATVRNTPGVVQAEPMMHRFAYVGNDLQDFYGIDPATISRATAMSNAYFGNNDAAATLALLAATPNGVLVSDETVTDFQLSPGDTIKLRLQAGPDRAFRDIPFTFIGVAREFPTAPHDSFLIANASYVAEQTGNADAETVLARTGPNAPAVASALRTGLDGHGFKITDISEAAHIIGSTLTAVDLGGLGRIQLLFAIPLAAGAIGLVHLLSVAERRRSFTILEALGATKAQRAAFRWSEAIIIFVAGSSAGTLIGAGLATMLVKMMTGVFDPPPDYPAAPWTYLVILFTLAALFAALTVVFTGEGRKMDIPSGLKDLPT